CTQLLRPAEATFLASEVRSVPGTGTWSLLVRFGTTFCETPQSSVISCSINSLWDKLLYSSLCTMKALVAAMSKKCRKIFLYHFIVLCCVV
ncbi:hypothetical protein PDJAM_G00257250, partial [Pangasius djambal]|nr:hypothetical protein [Pangasius djambal]